MKKVLMVVLAVLVLVMVGCSNKEVEVKSAKIEVQKEVQKENAEVFKSAKEVKLIGVNADVVFYEHSNQFGEITNVDKAKDGKYVYFVAAGSHTITKLHVVEDGVYAYDNIDSDVSMKLSQFLSQE